MARQRTAIISELTKYDKDRISMTLQLPDDDPMGFSGGMYIILNSGVLISEKKYGKRAYSICSSDEEQSTVQLAIRNIEEGEVSQYFCDFKQGQELQFSGPWGKLKAPAASGKTLVFCTDTGLTAAAGICLSAQHFPTGERPDLSWYRTDADYFLPQEWIEKNLVTTIGSVTQLDALSPKHPERFQHALSQLTKLDDYHNFYLIGDGTVIHPLKQHLLDLGLEEHRIQTEYYFAKPPKK